MEFRDLKTQYLQNKEAIDSAIQEVLLAGRFIGGEQVGQLEERLAQYTQVKHCITCANGTDALQLALMAWGIGPGDAVFVPDFTFFSTAEVVPWVGATPVFVDVETDTFNLSSASLRENVEAVLQQGKLVPKVIIAVDLFGQPANYAEIRKVADEYGLLLLEDAAQGFGGSIDGKKACSFGDIATTSFFPAKPLGCYGDGGAVFTDNDEWAELIRSYKVHGKGKDKYDNVRIGMNSRLDTLQAAILLKKFECFTNVELKKINDIAVLYTNNLKDIVEVPVVKENYVSSWAQYTIKAQNTAERDNLQKYLKEKGVPSMIYYARPLSWQKAFGNTHQVIQCSNAAYLCKTVLSLPIHPYMKDNEIKYVIHSIKNGL